MAISKKVINKKFIVDTVKSSLNQLDKNHLIGIAKLYGADVKSKMLKDDIIKLILDTKGVDYWDIYQKNKKYHFGIYSKKLEDLLNIDSRLRRKLEKKGVLKVAYQLENPNYKNSYLNFYDLECLYKMNKTQWEECKTKYAIKELTDKQKQAIIKREETLRKKKEAEEEKLRLATTCTHCGYCTMDMRFIEIINGKPYCQDCISTNDEIYRYNKAIEEFFKPIYQNKEQYLIMDIETTNLRFDDICSISIIDFDGNILLDEVVKPYSCVSEGATNVHNITNEQAQMGIPHYELAKKITDVFEDKKIIYYNIGGFTLDEYFENSNIKSSRKVCFTDDNANELSLLSIFEFISCERYFDIVNNNADSEYSHAIASYHGYDSKRAGIDSKTANHSLEDCFRMRDGIEYYAKKEFKKYII